MSAVPPAPTFGWKQALLALVCVELVLIALYFDTARAMVEIWWRSETFNHAFLVPPIALWLIWEKGAALLREQPRPSLGLVLPFAIVALGWLLGDLAAVNAVTQFAFVALLVLAVPLVIGVAAARRITFPLFFLFFAVPFGEFVMPKLMEWTAMFTVMGLRASGIPVYQEGLHFVIPSGRWSVVEACSGVRYLIASVVVGTLYAYLNYQSLKRRLVFVGFAILVPLIANWLRAYMIVMLGHYSGNTLAVGVDHLIYGWVFFGIVIMIMFAIGMRWREHEIPLPAHAEGSSAVSAGGLSNFALAVALALGLGGAPHAVLVAMNAGPELSPPVLSADRLATGGWQPTTTPPAAWQPAFANPSATLHAGLEKDGSRIGVFIAWYRQQNYERKLISSQNELVKSKDKAWAQVGSGVVTASLGGQAVALRAGTLRSNLAGLGAEPQRLRVWYGYWIDGRMITSDHLGKLLLALARLRGRGDDAAAVFVYAVEPEADRAVADYLASAGDGIVTLLNEAVASAPTLTGAYTATQ